MTSNFNRWEADPLFSAAEVIQDSADRMESVFRSLLHEHSLVHDNPDDQKLLNSIEFHRRDLRTALGTTKWQLEDFERVVNWSALSNTVHMNEANMPRHKQFIRAIKEQILLMEKSLEDDPSVGDINKNLLNSNDQDRDNLALFLSGSNSLDDSVNYDTGRNIVKRYLGPTTASGFGETNNEIVELKSDEPSTVGEIEQVKVNGVGNSDSSFGPENLPQFCSSKENKISKVDSLFHEDFDVEASGHRDWQNMDSLQGAAGDRDGEGLPTEAGAWDLEADCTAKSFFSKSKLRASRSRLNIFGFLGNSGNFGFISGTRMVRSFTKRRKDGEMDDQVKHRWLGLFSTSSIFQRLHFEELANTMQPHGWLGAFRRRFQRSLYFIQYNRYPIHVVSAIFVTLIVIGILAFHVA